MSLHLLQSGQTNRSISLTSAERSTTIVISISKSPSSTTGRYVVKIVVNRVWVACFGHSCPRDYLGSGSGSGCKYSYFYRSKSQKQCLEHPITSNGLDTSFFGLKHYYFTVTLISKLIRIKIVVNFTNIVHPKLQKQCLKRPITSNGQDSSVFVYIFKYAFSLYFYLYFYSRLQLHDCVVSFYPLLGASQGNDIHEFVEENYFKSVVCLSFCNNRCLKLIMIAQNVVVQIHCLKRPISSNGRDTGILGFKQIIVFIIVYLFNALTFNAYINTLGFGKSAKHVLIHFLHSADADQRHASEVQVKKSRQNQVSKMYRYNSGTSHCDLSSKCYYINVIVCTRLNKEPNILVLVNTPPCCSMLAVGELKTDLISAECKKQQYYCINSRNKIKYHFTDIKLSLLITQVDVRHWLEGIHEHRELGHVQDCANGYYISTFHVHRSTFICVKIKSHLRTNYFSKIIQVTLLNSLDTAVCLYLRTIITLFNSCVHGERVRRVAKWPAGERQVKGHNLGVDRLTAINDNWRDNSWLMQQTVPGHSPKDSVNCGIAYRNRMNVLVDRGYYVKTSTNELNSKIILWAEWTVAIGVIAKCVNPKAKIPPEWLRRIKRKVCTTLLNYINCTYFLYYLLQKQSPHRVIAFSSLCHHKKASPVLYQCCQNKFVCSTIPCCFRHSHFEQRYLFFITYSDGTALSLCLSCNNNHLKSKYILLITIHPNPGPVSSNVVLSLHTYNVNGLGNENKSKRILNKFLQPSRQAKGAKMIIALQETHLIDESIPQFNNKWRHEAVHSTFTSNSAGVSILYFAHQWESQINTYSNDNGRICSVTLKGSNNDLYTFISIYAPNIGVSNVPIEFIDEVELHLDEINLKYPGTHVVLMGDFNFTINNLDFVIRRTLEKEVQIRNRFETLRSVHNLTDSYRQNNPKGGFTWGHRNAILTRRSRLDRIYTSEGLKILSSIVTIDFDKSDHSLVTTEIEFNTGKTRGPGSYKIDITVLEIKDTRDRIEQELKNAISEIPQHFDPHLRWDYIKMKIRETFMMETNDRNSKDKLMIQILEVELNTLLRLQEEELLLNRDPDSRKSVILKKELERCESETSVFREIYAKKLIMKSRAQWAEEGEKSTKYFLNLMKYRSAATYIDTLQTPRGPINDQQEIRNEIQGFYTDLYSNKETDNSTISQNEFLNDMPKISPENKAILEKEITLNDLFTSLKTCKDSSPGPDGIPYSVYTNFWNILSTPLLQSWVYSRQIGRMSQDQRSSIITLIPKKDKDTSILNNLRPISLTNTDVKIITKAITIKVNPVLESIISPTQAAYVPGRQITDNTFMIDRIIELADKIDERIYLLSLDAKKAFDSVDHKYMYSSLKAYGFGDEFIKTIQTIYKDLTASVMVNGFKSGVIKLLRGVKQGDALSCALFVIIIDPLVRAIERSNEIKSIEVTSPFTGEKIEVKTSVYADDLTPIASNMDSVQNIFHLYHKFSKVSGLYLNPDKTEILCVGGRHPKPRSINIQYGDEIYNITLSQRIKVCGISHPISDPESYKSNIAEHINKLKTQLNMWRARNLSLKGKILITKVFGLSQLIYFMQTCPVNTEDLKKIETLLFGFIWNCSSNRPNDKIKRAVMKGTLDEGGLAAPDISSLDTALKYRRLIRTTLNNKHPVSIIQDKYLHKLGVYDKLVHLLSPKFLKNFPDKFYKTALLFNNKIINDRHCEIGTRLHANEYIPQNLLNLIANTPMASSPEMESHPQKLQLRLQLKLRNLHTYGDIIQSRDRGNNGAGWLTTLQAYQQIPLKWKNLLRQNNTWDNNGAIETPFFTDSKGRDIVMDFASTKHIRMYITQTQTEAFDLERLALKHDVNIENALHIPKNPFNTWFTKQTYHQSFHFRVLHRAITTRSKLEKYRIIDSDICPFCDESEDDFEHALYRCDLSKYTWSNFQTYLDKIHSNFSMTVPHIILGIARDVKHSMIINTVAMRVKQILLSPKSERRCLSVDEIVNIAKDQYQLEFAMALRHKTIPVTGNYVFQKNGCHIKSYLRIYCRVRTSYLW